MDQNQIRITTHVTPGGCGFLKLWEVCPQQELKLLQKIRPKNSQAEILLAEFLTENLLLIVDCSARIVLFDIKVKKEVRTVNLEGSNECGACLTEDQEFLLLGVESKSTNEKELIQLKLPDLTIQTRVSLPPKAQPKQLWSLKEQQALVYFKHGGDLGKGTEDGLYKIDLRGKSITAQPFTLATGSSFSQPPIAIAAHLGLGLRVDYNPIEIRKLTGEKRYLAKVQLFDLKDCSEVRCLTVRSFFGKHVFEDEHPEIALQALDLSPDEEEYQEAQTEFLERITALAFCHQEAAFWVAFQHGLIRKISLDGKEKSILIASSPMTGEEEGDPYLPTHFNNPLQVSADDTQIIFGEPASKLMPAALDFETEDEELLILPESSSEEQLHSLTAKDIEEFSWNYFELKGDDEKSYLETLELLVQKCDPLDNLRDGQFLRFAFLTPQGKQDEDSFFKSCSQFPKALPLMEQFLRRLSAHRAPLWYGEYLPAGIFAIQPLVMQDKQYLTTLRQYLASGIVTRDIGSEKLTTIINEIIEYYGYSTETIDLLLTRATYQISDGIEQLEAFLQKDGFKQYLEDGDNRDNFKKHKLYQPLESDYFAIFCPLEHQLYEAVVWGNLEKVQQLIQQGVNIEKQHPEYTLTALGCAIKLEKETIVQLLLKTGAQMTPTDYKLRYPAPEQKKRPEDQFSVPEDFFGNFAAEDEAPLHVPSQSTATNKKEGVGIPLENLRDADSCERSIRQMTESLKIETLANASNRLLFYFITGQEDVGEKEFFSQLPMNAKIAQAIRLFLEQLIELGGDDLWYNEEIQTGMFALQALVTYDKKYIIDFITYLKSNIIDHEKEENYPSTLIEKILDQYGWCEETMHLVIARGLNCGGPFGFDELRLQVKKGGLRDFLQDGEQYQHFRRLWLMEAKKEEEKWRKLDSLIGR